MDQEFADIDSQGRWQNLYVEIRSQSHECPYKVAKYPENRIRNRYRDVSPFDHSRVKLKNSENDYINASLVVMEEAQRSYILTQELVADIGAKTKNQPTLRLPGPGMKTTDLIQLKEGPLKSTCGHFWLMIWEQRTKAVIMLNRVIEKGIDKCAQYWPTQEVREMAFRDTRFVVTLVSEDVKSYYTTRTLELRNSNTGETREICHFHYTSWPDFGVPESPASFLNFLFKVRESGSLGVDHGPAVVHCSAGIGRSGTFSLVDTCLVLLDKRKEPSSVDVKKILLDMRKFRMGLIQTPDQLRFSYLAIMEGSKCIMGDSSVQKRWPELSKEDQEPGPDSPPPAQPAKRPADKFNGSRLSHSGEAGDPDIGRTAGKEPDLDGNVGNARKRHREERVANAAPKALQGKQRTSETEKKRKSSHCHTARSSMGCCEPEEYRSRTTDT